MTEVSFSVDKFFWPLVILLGGIVFLIGWRRYRQEKKFSESLPALEELRKGFQKLKNTLYCVIKFHKGLLTPDIASYINMTKDADEDPHGVSDIDRIIKALEELEKNKTATQN